MSSSVVECGNCSGGFDIGLYNLGVSPRGAPLEVMKPWKCPHCGAVASEPDANYNRTWEVPKETTMETATEMMGDRRWGNPASYTNRAGRRATVAIRRKDNKRRGSNFTQAKKKRK